MQTGRRSGRQAMQSCARSGLALAVCPAHGQRHLHRLTGTDRDPQQQAGRHSAASEHGRQPGLGFWPGQATQSVRRFPSPLPSVCRRAQRARSALRVRAVCVSPPRVAVSSLSIAWREPLALSTSAGAALPFVLSLPSITRRPSLWPITTTTTTTTQLCVVHYARARNVSAAQRRREQRREHCDGGDRLAQAIDNILTHPSPFF